jgi:hypothetical protein
MTRRLRRRIGYNARGGGGPVRFAAVGDPHLLAVDHPPKHTKTTKQNLGCKAEVHGIALVALLHRGGLSTRHVAPWQTRVTKSKAFSSCNWEFAGHLHPAPSRSMRT